MKKSYKLSYAVHTLVYIELCKDEPSISSRQISESVSTNAGVIRRIMSQLKKADLIETRQGTAETKLSRSPKEISLLDVFKAVEDESIINVNHDTNMDCPVGKNIQIVLENAYEKVQTKAEEEMKQITLQQLIDELMNEIQA